MRKLSRRSFLMVSVFMPCALIVLLLGWLRRDEQLDVDWSSEGEWIVFSCGLFSLSNPISHLYIVRPDGSELQRITTDRYLAKSPKWSPDGERIAFISKDAIYKTKPDATEVEKIFDRSELETYPLENIEDIDWASDGWFVISTSSLDGGRLYKLNRDGTHLEMLIHRDGFLSGPKWSPDNRLIGFSVVVSNPDAGIYTINPETREVIQIYDYAGILGRFDWSTSGEELIISLGGSQSQFYRLNMEMGELLVIDSIDVSFGSPSWSPDGQWIVFSGYTEAVDRPKNIYKARPDGSEVVRLTDMDDCNATGAQWFDFDPSRAR